MMTRKPIELEEIAFTVDTSRMLETLRRSRLSDRYAYVRDLMASAQSRNAKTIRVRGRGRKIVLKDDGNGITYEDLDERLATIFNEGEMDDLAGGILSSFDAGASTVRIDTAPSEKEAYSVMISYDGESFSISDREKTTLTAGTALTILKKKRKDGSSWWQGLKAEKKLRDKWSYLTTGGSPEVLRVRDAVAATGMGLDVIVNGRRTQRKQEQLECLVKHQFDYNGVSGTIGFLASPDIYQKISNDKYGSSSSLKGRSSSISVYRKGFFQGKIDSNHLPLLHTSPFSAEVNCNTLKVDISGNSMDNDKSAKGLISDAINSALPGLVDKLLDLKPSQERDRHLLFWMNSYLGSVLGSIPKTTPLSVKNYSTSYALSNVLEEKKIFSRLAKAPLIPTKTGRASLEDLVSTISLGDNILLDYQGYGIDNLSPYKHVVKMYDESVGDLVDEIFSNINYGGMNIERHGSRSGRRIYRWAGNESRESRDKTLEKIKPYVPSVLYRPLQVTGAYYGFIRSMVDGGEFDYYGGEDSLTNGKKGDLVSRGAELFGATLVFGLTWPVYLAALPFAAAYGAGETVVKYLVMPPVRAIKPHWPVIKEKSQAGLEGLVNGSRALVNGSKALGIGVAKTAMFVGGGLGLIVASPFIGLYYAGRAGVHQISKGIDALQDRYSPVLQARRLAREDRRRLSASNAVIRKGEMELQKKEQKEERERRKALLRTEKKESQRDIVYRRVAEDYFKNQLVDDPHFPANAMRIYHYADRSNCSRQELYDNSEFWRGSGIVAAYDDSLPSKLYINGTRRRWRRFITAIAEMRHKENVTPFVGSYLIAECPLIRRRLESRIDRGQIIQSVAEYQSSFFEQRVESFYNTTAQFYQTGEADKFFAAYEHAPRPARIELFTRILPLERQSSIDDRLAENVENLPLMEEAARLMVERK